MAAFFSLAFTFLCFGIAPSLASSVPFRTSSTMSAMELHGVVPDVIDAAPTDKLKIHYPSGVDVELGNELTPTQVKDEPQQIEWSVEPGAHYTLCMADPDGPSRAEPTAREVLHWLVVNIPGHDVHLGEVLAEYRGSGAPQGTGLHRYVLLVYKQPGLLVCDEPRISKTTRTGRPNFSVRKFAAKYNLGQPVAGNFFQAQWDEYVPILQAQTVG